MKNTALTFCLITAIAAGLASEGFAAGEHRGGPRINFEQADANADGQLSREELQAHGQARFADADTDQSGGLSRAELEARMKAQQDDRRARMLDRMFERRDADADGQLTFAELSSDRSAKMFERADADQDGMISKAEFDAAKEAGKRAGPRID